MTGIATFLDAPPPATAATGMVWQPPATALYGAIRGTRATGWGMTIRTGPTALAQVGPGLATLSEGQGDSSPALAGEAPPVTARRIGRDLF
jgi:hypothetical protein